MRSGNGRLNGGLPLMVWTFDPVQSRNAYLNIVKLGAVVRKYKVNYYGNYSTSTLHRGLDTDRLLARVVAGIAARDVALAETAGKARIRLIPWRRLMCRWIWRPSRRVIWKRRACGKKNIRTRFVQYLQDGLYCAGFVRGTADVPSQYLFYPDQESH
ncbi:MAG: hypothetical protein U0Y68_06745 [Blastocatellia bacterium]